MNEIITMSFRDVELEHKCLKEVRYGKSVRAR